MYTRFAMDLPRFLRQRVTPEIARATLAARLASRETNFLKLVDRAVYGWPDSPYLPLFRYAGCERGDVARMVREDGLEAALARLDDAGVRVSFEEFKGRVPLKRGSRTFDIRTGAFDNPFTTRHYETQSSGSTGAATRVNMDLDHVASTLPTMMATYEAHGLIGWPTVLYRAGMPSSIVTNTILRHVVIGNPVRRWFSPLTPAETASPLRFRIAEGVLPALVRLARAPFPRRELVPFDRAVIVARAAASYVRDDGRCLVRCAVSTSLTVAIAARESGIDLHGVTFMGAAEPSSPAKVKGILESGASYVSAYSMSESGPLGAGCRHGTDHTDVHFMRDRMAVIQRPEPVPGTHGTVNGLSLTTLLMTGPKIMINVASGDFGVLEERSCGCLLGDIGLFQHLRQIQSIQKLTGRGITLVGDDIAGIIEGILPNRFGGTAQDYQLIEEETEAGVSELVLLVSPSVVLDDEAAPAAVLLEALARGRPGARFSAALLRNASAVKVRRQRPCASARGKQPAFRTAASR